MPENRLIKAAEISVLVHATEDEEKVKQAVKRLAKYEHDFESQHLTGHYDDPITFLKSVTSKKKEATDFMTNIANKLSSLDRELLLQELQKHVDPQGNLYIRLDKQKAYHGRAVLNENDPIRIKFKLQLPHKADSAAVVREYIINLEDDNIE